jgi:predicted PurR-regulated permease PerM
VQLLFRRAVQAVGGVLSFGLGLLLFAIAGFFFLRDGSSIVQAWEELTPLAPEQDRQARRQFAVVCRAVVLSTFLAALAQAVALGLGIGALELAFGLGLGKWLVPLFVLAFALSMIPMVGPSLVWLPLAAWMLYERQYAAGLILAALGVIVVSSVDNLVRMAVLHGSAGMHPLLALVSVLGGLHQMGVLGAFVGPVVAGVFLTLLRILRQQLDQPEAPPRSGLVPAQEVMPVANAAHRNPAP